MNMIINSFLEGNQAPLLLEAEKKGYRVLFLELKDLTKQGLDMKTYRDMLKYLNQSLKHKIEHLKLEKKQIELGISFSK